jgi:hypothetical protein
MAGRIGNRILDSLPENESSRLLFSSKVVSWQHEQVVFQPDGPMPHVYFPTTGVFGIVLVVDEGMVGLPVFLGVDFHPFLAVMQVPGEAVRVPAATFLQAATPGTTFDRLVRR